jgi:hypothetical protein
MRFYKSTLHFLPGASRYSLSCCILFFLVSSFTTLHAQVWIDGYLKDKVSRTAIANGEVHSSLSNALSDSNGFFRIRVIEGDIISVKKFAYRFDTIHFSLRKIDSNLVIYMDPLGSIMKNVTVSTSYSAYQVDSMRRRMAFDEGRSKTTFVSKSYHEGFGLQFSLDRFTKSKDKHLQKQKKLFETTEQWSYIRFRFPDSLVQSYTNLSGDDLRIFMNRYTPSYEWLREHPSKMEVVMYINEKLKLFRKENER